MVRGIFTAIMGITSAAMAFEISGVVQDPEGTPAANASVWVRQEGQMIRTASDAEGRFVWPDADAAPTDVVVWKEGYGLDGFNGLIVGPLTIQFHLRKPDALTLRVVDRDYKPVEGARIKTMLVNDRLFVPVEELAAHGFPASRSTAEGVLSIADLPQGGHVQFVVSHAQYADTFVAYLPVGGQKQNILIEDGVALRGRVTAPGGQGLAGAVVTVFRLGTAGRKTLAEVRTDPEGFYAACAPPGECFVRVWHAEYASPKPQPVVIKRASEATVCDLAELAPRIIEGAVAGPDGKPFAGVLTSYWEGDTLYAETYTKSDGRFRFLIPSDQGLVRISPPPGFMTEDLAEIPVRMGGKSSAKLSPMRLKPLPEITGGVFGEDGQSAPNVLIASRGIEPPLWAITDSDGRFAFRLVRMPEEKKVAFRAEHPSQFLRGEFSVDVKSPAPVSVTLQRYEPDVTPPEPRPGGNDLSVMVDKPAPEIACDTWFNSEPLTIEALKGKVVVMLFWAAFDQRPETFACVEELRALSDLYKEATDVVLLGVHDSASSPEDVRKGVEMRRVAFPVGRDDESSSTFERYGVRYIPQIVLLDKSGALKYWQTGGRLMELIKVLRRQK